MNFGDAIGSITSAVGSALTVDPEKKDHSYGNDSYELCWGSDEVREFVHSMKEQPEVKVSVNQELGVVRVNLDGSPRMVRKVTTQDIHHDKNLTTERVLSEMQEEQDRSSHNSVEDGINQKISKKEKEVKQLTNEFDRAWSRERNNVIDHIHRSPGLEWEDAPAQFGFKVWIKYHPSSEVTVDKRRIVGGELTFEDILEKVWTKHNEQNLKGEAINNVEESKALEEVFGQTRLDEEEDEDDEEFISEDEYAESIQEIDKVIDGQ